MLVLLPPTLVDAAAPAGGATSAPTEPATALVTAPEPASQPEWVFPFDPPREPGPGAP